MTRYLLLLLLVLSLSFSVTAQKSNVKPIRFEANNRLAQMPIFKISNSQTLIKELLNTKDVDAFNVTKSHRDDLGIDHRTYQQYYNGIKVEGGIITGSW